MVSGKQVTRSELEARKGPEIGVGFRSQHIHSSGPAPPRSAYAGNLLVRVDFLVPRQSSRPGGLKHFHVFSVPATAKSAKREDLLVGSACVRLLWKDSKDWFCFGGFPKHPIPILQGWAREN